MAECVVRSVSPDDLPHLRKLFLTSRRETFHWVDPAKYLLADFDEQTDGEVMLLAEMGGAVAGFVSWWAARNFVHHLYVAREFQRRGVGLTLLTACLARIGRPSQLKCAVRNENAFNFYLSHGWEALESGRDTEGEYRLMQLDAKPQ